MTVEELDRWARLWANGQQRRWVYGSGTEAASIVEAAIKEARSKIEALGYRITTDDWANVVIVMPFKV